jgi:hypothetical protein
MAAAASGMITGHLRFLDLFPAGSEFGREFCPMARRFGRIEAFLQSAFNVLW